MKLVQAWIDLHRDDLMADWFLASSGQTPFSIHYAKEILEMTPDAIRVKPLPDFRLEVDFETGERRFFDTHSPPWLTIICL